MQAKDIVDLVLLAALLLIPVLMLRVGLGELPGNWRPLMILGFCNSAIPFLLLTYSTLVVTAGFWSVINATAPLWGAVVVWVWLAERLLSPAHSSTQALPHSWSLVAWSHLPERRWSPECYHGAGPSIKASAIIRGPVAACE